MRIGIVGVVCQLHKICSTKWSKKGKQKGINKFSENVEHDGKIEKIAYSKMAFSLNVFQQLQK